jgi:hypothetical protein
VSQRSFLHLACALLLLLAQHGALTHSVWHLSRHAPAEHANADGKRYAPERNDGSPQSRLCDLHWAMGSLLAGDCAGQSVSDTLPLSHWLAASTAAWRVAQPVVTPPSRAPPVLL